MELTARIYKRLSQTFTLKVEFSVPDGITMLFGPSGAGKTTLLRCVAGLARPDSGRVAIGSDALYDSERILEVPVPQRNIGYVFQNLALFPHLTVAENVTYGLGALDESSQRERVQSILALFRVAHLAQRKPGEISGGEQQRVALARSLVTDPCLLLLDEPLSALDYATVSRIMEDLRAWNATQRIPILYVTHTHREVFALGERVIVLDGGRILTQGRPLEVLEAPSHELVAQLAGFENIFDAAVISRDEESGTMHARLKGSDLELEVPLLRPGAAAEIRIAIRAGDIIVATQRPTHLSARNILPGTISSLHRAKAQVIVEVDAGAKFEVHLTPKACEVLALKRGDAAWLVIKTFSCHMIGSDSN
jgi:molybdate transport system ATP-binding protein